MPASGRWPRSLGRLFATYAAISLVPVLALGVVLAGTYRAEAQRRGVAEGRSEALLVARTAVEPLLDGRPLGDGLSATEQTGLTRLVARVVSDHNVLRLRLRNMAGEVVFSDDGSGFSEQPEDEALDATKGEVVARLTHLNTDENDSGRRGVAAVEVYLPLDVGASSNRVGVLEIYLPYAPISQDITAGLHQLYLDLAVGLTLLYLTLFAISASVSRRLRREASLNAFLAHHDTLTELPNRAMFHQKGAAALDRGHRRHQPVAVAIVDLDRFKEVNDTLGHHSGDRLLCELARRLELQMRPHDTVARLGGDEFGIILTDVADPEATLWRLRAIIDQEVDMSGLALSVDASIGFALSPDDGVSVDELLRHADVAMYVAKAEHHGVVRYDPAHDHYDAANLTLIGELRHAIAANQLVLHYQPKARLVDGTIEAVEALVRWNHPAHGLLYPDRFIPLAEQTDLIDALTTWVLTAAVTQIRDLGPAWHALAVAVNVSARNLGRADFATEVAAVLRRLEVSPDRLIIEITETALLTDPARAVTVLAQLTALGVQISIDDFGQGQTSLGYLAELPVHELKIDKSFVVDMVVNPAHAAIVRSIIDLGHNLGFRVVAEGVETAAALSYLKITGCDVAQGYLLARPMPIDHLAHWLASVPTNPAPVS